MTLTFTDTVTPTLMFTLTLAATQETAGAHSFSFNPANPMATTAIMSGASIPAGTYTVTLSYSDYFAHGLATATSTNVTLLGVPDAKWIWARQAGSSGPGSGSGTDSGRSVAVDGTGNVFVTGSFSGTMSFPGSAITPLTASGGTDIFLAKYDNAGTLLWAVRAGGLAADAGHGVAVDGAGDAYVTGSYSGTALVDFGSGNTLPAPAGARDIFVAKFAALNGGCRWAVQKGGADADRGFGIAVAPTTGDVLVTGEWGQSGGGNDVFVLKLSSANGDQLGSTLSTGTGPMGHSGTGRAIAVDINNDVYVAGNYSLGTISFPPGTAPVTAPIFSGGYTRAFAVKLAGTTLSALGLGHSSNLSATFSHDATGIAVDPNSTSVYVTGYFNGIADFGSGITLVNRKNPQNGATFNDQLYDYFIVKFNTANGTLNWAIKGNGLAPAAQPDGDPASDDETRGIAVDYASNVYVTGFLHPNAPGPFINEGPTVLVASYSSAGALRWTRNAEDADLAGSPEDTGLGIALDTLGCVHITGDFTEVLDFPPPPELLVASLSSSPSNVRDMFVAKVCPTCGGGLDTDGDGILNVTDPDDDNDGLPDVWEVMWAFDPLNPNNALVDSDGDGTSNLIEYAFGLNPTMSDSGAIIVTNGIITQRGMPTVLLTNTPSGAVFRALFGRRKDYVAAGLTYTAQFSSDLVTWMNSVAVPTVIADDGEIEAVTVPHPFFVNGRKARFFRLQVTTNAIP